MCSFPDVDNDDIVDSTTQFLNWVVQNKSKQSIRLL
jgi:phage terminase large subunit-like protein